MPETKFRQGQKWVSPSAAGPLFFLQRTRLQAVPDGSCEDGVIGNRLQY
jgi:hypothetical protein